MNAKTGHLDASGEIYPWAKANRNLRIMPFLGISLGLCRARLRLLGSDAQSIITIMQKKKKASWQKVKLEAEWTWNGDRWGVLWRVSLLPSLLPGQQGMAVPASRYTSSQSSFLDLQGEQAQLSLAQLKLPGMFCCCPRYCETLFIVRIHSIALV